MKIGLCTFVFTLTLGFSQFASAQQFTSLSYMRIAAQLAQNLDRPSLDDYYGWTIGQDSWHEALQDSLFGPFLASQEESPGHTMSCIIKQFTNNDVICVYFEGQTAYGYAAIKADAGHHFTTDEVKQAYKPITPDLLESHKDKAVQADKNKPGNATGTAEHLSNPDAIHAAAAIAYNLNHDSLDYYNGFIIENDAWHNALGDNLFGAFLSAQEERPGRTMVCIMSELYNDSTCVYFEDGHAYGYVALKVDMGHKYTLDEVKAAYKPTTAPLLQFPTIKEKNKIIEGQYELDNKAMIPADIITEGAP